MFSNPLRTVRLFSYPENLPDVLRWSDGGQQRRLQHRRLGDDRLGSSLVPVVLPLHDDGGDVPVWLPLQPPASYAPSPRAAPVLHLAGAAPSEVSMSDSDLNGAEGDVTAGGDFPWGWTALAVGSGLGLLGVLGVAGHVLEPVFDVFSIDRGEYVRRAFAESKGVPYSYAGGHRGFVWPRGGPGARGGVGWDCSGWVGAVVARAPRPPRFPVPNGNVGMLWAAAGRPLNTGLGSKPGDMIFWGTPWRPVHVGFVVGPDLAVSALGRGAATNADQPGQMVKLHSWRGTGLPLLGTVSW